MALLRPRRPSRNREAAASLGPAGLLGGNPPAGVTRKYGLLAHLAHLRGPMDGPAALAREAEEARDRDLAEVSQRGFLCMLAGGGFIIEPRGCGAPPVGLPDQQKPGEPEGRNQPGKQQDIERNAVSKGVTSAHGYHRGVGVGNRHVYGAAAPLGDREFLLRPPARCRPPGATP